MLELLSHIGSVSSPILIVIGTLYIRTQVLNIKVWALQTFEEKDK